MTVEPDLLEVERGPVPVAIEAGLADGHDPRGGRQGGDPVPVPRLGLGDVVRLDADGGENPWVGCGQRGDLGAIGGRDTDGNDLGYPGRAGPGEDAGEVVAERVVLEVGVRVDVCGGGRGRSRQGRELPPGGPRRARFGRLTGLSSGCEINASGRARG